MANILSIVQLNSYDFEQLEIYDNCYYFVYDWNKLYLYDADELTRLDGINVFACEQDRLYHISATKSRIGSFWYDLTGNRLWEISDVNEWMLIAGEDIDFTDYSSIYVYDNKNTYMNGTLTHVITENKTEYATDRITGVLVNAQISRTNNSVYVYINTIGNECTETVTLTNGVGIPTWVVCDIDESSMSVVEGSNAENAVYIESAKRVYCYNDDNTVPSSAKIHYVYWDDTVDANMFTHILQLPEFARPKFETDDEDDNYVNGMFVCPPQVGAETNTSNLVPVKIYQNGYIYCINQADYLKISRGSVLSFMREEIPVEDEEE